MKSVLSGLPRLGGSVVYDKVTGMKQEYRPPSPLASNAFEILFFYPHSHKLK